MASSPLVPCTGCRRHIRIDHQSCPFCRVAVPEGFEKRVIPPARRRLDRLATFTFATTLAVSACGEVEDDKQEQGTPAAQDGGRNADGMSPVDASTDVVVKKDGAVQDDGGMQAAYGLPVDASFDDVPVAPPYGLPPLDGGTD